MQPDIINKALVIDDDEEVCDIFCDLLKRAGLHVISAKDGMEGLKAFETENPDITLLDLNMPGMHGMDVLRELKQKDPEAPVIVITGYGDVATAVEALKLGAYDFLLKPFKPDYLKLTVRRALERSNLWREVKRLKSALKTSLGVQFGVSEEARILATRAEQLAGSNLALIIEGETGVGKSLAARMIHNFSARSGNPFVTVDMGAIAESLAESELFGHDKGAFTGADKRRCGLIESARGGTIFIDEIENMSPGLQAKMLRMVDEKIIQPVGSSRPLSVDVRIIAASNKCIRDLVAAGKFREDLYFRLGEFIITIPPLKNRKEDILYIANKFLDEIGSDIGRKIHLSESAIAKLIMHDWPGNIRELRNVIRRAVVLANSETIESGDIDFHLATAAPEKEFAGVTGSLQEAVREVEKKVIEKTLKMTNGNKTRAASILQIDFKTLTAKIREFNISN
jgi:DNA-binding NtrC family response regulator